MCQYQISNKRISKCENIIDSSAKLQHIPNIIQRGAVLSIAQASLPFTAASVCLKLTQKAIYLLNNGREIRQTEINKARRLGLNCLADVGDKINVLQRAVNKNQYGETSVLPLHRTQVSKRIIGAAGDIVELKMVFFRSAKYASIFLDESTTNSMKTRPVYCGAIGITDKFDWFMCFIGQKNTSGCESGKMYFDAVKAVCEPFCVWNNLKSVGTDGCHSMRSTALYAGLNAHGEIGESFIAYVNRDIAPKGVFAFHSVLHIISFLLAIV